MADDVAVAPPLKGAALIKDEVRRLPDKPGVYRMMGDDGEVLYVGKARSLKKRVIQYAQGRFHTNRIAHMVDATRSMEFIVTRTEASGGPTRTDADVVHMSRQGIPTAVVSIPLRYMHSPVELVELADVEATIELIAGMALRLEADQALTRWR